MRDIIKPIELISRLTARGTRHENIKHTTQFVVGAAGETDKEIISYSWRLYKGLGLDRIYFSAYQRGAGLASLPGEHSQATNSELLTREHRLYQVDWLIRKYGFKADEIPLDEGGNLSLEADPKEIWARRHKEFFPVNLNTAETWQLLRVPGLGVVTLKRVLALRQTGVKIRSFDELKKQGRVLKKAREYLKF